MLRYLSSLFLVTTLSQPSQKLVRDRIPELVQTGATFHKADDKEYQDFLRKKLQEEVDEFLENPCLEEMADIVEVLEAFCNSMGTSLDEMEKTRQEKAECRGKFRQKWIMTKGP